MAGAFGAGLIGDLAVIMVVSAVAILIFRRLHQPVVLGYLLAGMAVGPGNPFLALGITEENILSFADLGVIFLLLFTGMEFDLRQLRAVGIPAVVIGIVEVSAMLVIGFVLGLGMGLDQRSAVYLGALIAISSTAVTLKILSELHLLEDKETRLVIGILIVEDFAAVIMLSSLSGTGQAANPVDIFIVVGKVIIFFVITIGVGSIVIPRAFRAIERFASEEVLTISALGLSFGVSLVSFELGFSPAMGAFLAGVLIGECGVLDAIRPRFEPIRDLFAAVFFVSVGMLIIPGQFALLIGPIAVVTAVFALGKTAAAGGMTFLLGYGGRHALAVGTRLARTGEFSFIIGKEGLRVPAPGQPTPMRAELYPIIAGVTLVTTFIGPALIRYTPSLYRFFAGHLPPQVDEMGAAYSAWVSKARASMIRDPALRDRFRADGAQVFLYGVVVLAVSWLAVGLMLAVGEISPRVGMAPTVLVAAILVGATIFVLYPVVVIIRSGRDLVRLTVAAAQAGSATGRLAGKAAVARIVGGVIALGILSLFVVGLVPLFVAATHYVDPVILLALLLLLFVFAGGWVLRSTQEMHKRFESVFVTGMAPEDSENEGAPAVQKVSNLPRFQWAFHEHETLAEYVVPEGSPIAGRSLAELKIRGRTGARVVGVQHGDDLQTAPGQSTRIHESDLLLVVGTIADLERFEVILGRSPEMEIRDGSPV